MTLLTSFKIYEAPGIIHFSGKTMAFDVEQPPEYHSVIWRQTNDGNVSICQLPREHASNFGIGFIDYNVIRLETVETLVNVELSATFHNQTLGGWREIGPNLFYNVGCIFTWDEAIR